MWDSIERSRDDPLDCFALAPARRGFLFNPQIRETPPSPTWGGAREPAFMHATVRGLLLVLVLQRKRPDCGTASPVIAALC